MQEAPKKKKKKKKYIARILVDWRRERQKDRDKTYRVFTKSGHRENVSFLHDTFLNDGFQFRDILAAKAFGKKKKS